LGETGDAQAGRLVLAPWRRQFSGGGKFDSDDFAATGKAFAEDDCGKDDLDAYAEAVGEELSSLYEVEDSRERWRHE
jgi:hypothetical protein